MTHLLNPHRFRPYNVGGSPSLSNNLVGLWSPLNLGNQRGTVVETEATYTSPSVRLRRTSDDAEKSFTGTEVAVGVAKDWVNEGFLYESDFSAGADGVSALRGTVAGNIDGIGGVDDTLRHTADATAAGAATGFRHNTEVVLVVGQSYRATVDVYLPSGQTEARTIGFVIPSTLTMASGTGRTNLTDQWVTLTYEFTAAATSLLIALGDAAYSTTGFTAAVAGDLMYAKNYAVQGLTEDGHVVTLYDQSGNDLDLTQSTAASQPQLVDAGVYLRDANGNIAPYFDGTDDQLDNNAVATSTQGSEIQLTVLGVIDFSDVDTLDGSLCFGLSTATGTDYLLFGNNDAAASSDYGTFYASWRDSAGLVVTPQAIDYAIRDEVHLYTAGCDGAVPRQVTKVDGVNRNSNVSNLGAVAWDRFSMGCFTRTTSANHMVGFVTAAAVYAHLDETQLATVETSLMSTFGITPA